ncbi:MAG: glycosyltransferase family 2 protein [Methanomassiliicoccaceae archaeon]|jgi:glycosyltransferase involved in cell wall biosynthesis|nr:glycosyltransferase family 2 protein [Methanomassiliicoccaceae archaeon]
MKKISIMVPTYNEEGNVIPLVNAIIGQFTEFLSDYDYEILFIDNDSKDSTREKLRGLCASNPKIKAIFNARNYGQFSSPYYGILQATGDCVIAMCADFQDPVELIPQYVNEWESGYKIVLGQKTASKESGIKRGLRSFYYKFLRKHSDVNFIKHVTGSGLYDRGFVDVMRNIEDPKPFIRGIVAEMGHHIRLIPFDQPPRKTGKSSNGIFGYYDAGMQGLTSYTKFGVRAAVFFGTLFTLGSIAVSIGLGIYKLLNWHSFELMGLAFNMAIFIAVSLQMLFIGLVGEHVLNVSSRMKKRPLVIEAERINFSSETSEKDR